MCDCDKELGELRLALDAMYRRLAEMEQRIRDLEARARDDDRRMTGWTVTPAPVWDAEEVRICQHQERMKQSKSL